MANSDSLSRIHKLPFDALVQLCQKSVLTGLRQCRKQLLISIKSLIDTEFAYSKVELREDFDQLKIQYDYLKNESDLLKNNFYQLIDSCKILIEQTRDILSERDNYYSEWQYVRNILTPRPDWDKCSPLIINWKNLSIGKTSNQLVDVLINEIVHGNTEENNDEYLPMIINEKRVFIDGSKEELSKEKFIKNRHMRRRITGLLIKEIWSKKLFDENRLEIKLTDYVFDYLTKRFDNKTIAIEISSNIKDACHRYRNTYEINLFWQILTGQVEENVYHYEMKQYGRILQYLIKLCSQSRTIQWSDFVNALHQLYPYWTDERISLLIKSAERDLQESSIEKNAFEFLVLFMEDDEGHIGEFLKTIREQLQLDKNEYIEKIKNILIEHPLIKIKQFKQAVRLIDPLISEKELQRYVNWVFEPQKAGILKQIQARDFEEVILRLESCSCFMH